MIVARKISSLTALIPVAAGLLLIFLSNLLGVEYPTIPIVYSILLMPVIILGINYPFYRFNFPIAVLYNYGLLIANDLMLRYYTDTIDKVDEEWISLSFVGVFILSTVLMTYMGIVTGRDARRRNAGSFCAWGRCGLILFVGVSVAVAYFFFIQGHTSHSFEF